LKTAHKTLLSLGALMLLMALGVTFIFWTYQQIENASEQRRDSRIVITAAEDLLAAMIDAETGQRGYALTGNQSYLGPYLAVRESLKHDLDHLRQLSGNEATRQHLDSIAPLLDAKLAEMEKTISLRRNQDLPGVLALVGSDVGKRLMDAIRLEMRAIVQIENDDQLQHNQQFDASMRRLFLILVGIAVLSVLLAALLTWASYRAAQQKLKDLVHHETRHLLAAQTLTSESLQQVNQRLTENQQKLAITLSSIGDAVISTDAQACITLLNPVAEDLTGWTSAQALGRPVDEVFHIVNKDSRLAVTIPVADALAHGTVQGLANHTVLIARDGREFDIADSCAPIRDAQNRVVGAVLVFRNVTEEYAAQQRLSDSSAQMQAILSTVVDGIVTIEARGGLLETINPAIERMFGYSAAELRGQAFGLLIPELDQEAHHVALGHYGVSEEARAQGLGREVTGFRKDGSAFPLEIAVSEMSLRGQRFFTGILRDISARKQAEEALRRAGALQNAIFQSANFSCIATDAQGVIQIFNVGAECMLGYAGAEVIDQITPADISDTQELIARAKALSAELETNIAPGFEALVFKASRGIEDIYELTYIRKDGSRFPGKVSVTALRDAAQAIIGYLLIGIDNTARIAAEDGRAHLDRALKIKNIELEAACAAADKANLAKSEFLSSMSHELRSPLNAILGFAQLMESGVPAPSPDQAASIAQVLKAGWYLLELINEILDLALIESGRLSMSLEPVSLAEVLLDCQAMIDPQANGRSIDMHYPLFASPCFVAADRTRLKQVFVNLLSNAIKYNRKHGSVTVSFRAVNETRLQISVRDTGHGLSAKKLSQLFQPFNRLGQENNGEEGTGIGLVVSKRLVELMGGAIGAHSTVGVGSEFWIELNLAIPHELLPETRLTPVDEATLAPDTAAVRHLLYVEDNQANMELVAQIIARRPDMRLLRAEDGLRGIALARSHQPDVILMDIHLPGISGLLALSLLRDDPLTRHIPVLALSANAMPRDIEKGLQAGFFRYLTKPIKIPEFLLALDQCLALAPEMFDDLPGDVAGMGELGSPPTHWRHSGGPN
jgi:PAS domain S-box-containing protein